MSLVLSERSNPKERLKYRELDTFPNRNREATLWEARTYLRRLYGLDARQQKRESKKGTPKDLSKAPTRVQGLTGEKVVVVVIAEKVASLDGEKSMMQQYKIKLLLIDNKIKGMAECDEDLERPEIPSGDENLMAVREMDKEMEVLPHRAVATLSLAHIHFWISKYFAKMTYCGSMLRVSLDHPWLVVGGTMGVQLVLQEFALSDPCGGVNRAEGEWRFGF